MSHSATTTTADVLTPGHLGELTHTVPPEMVDAALETTGGKEHRFRRLPSRVIIYLLLAGSLFADQGWAHVFSRLTSGMTTMLQPAKSAITAAMRRVGPAPLRELFTLLSGWATSRTRPAVTFAGRLVVAIDGTQIPIPDTDVNRAVYPKPASGPNGPAGYPMVRLLALVTCGTRQVIDAVFGTDRVGEQTYATRLLPALQPRMLLLADRNFATYDLFKHIHATGADFLIRAKEGPTAMTLPVLAHLRDGSYLSHANGVKVRVVTATVTITSEKGTTTGNYRLVTTLLDPSQAPAPRLIELYHSRWEIETMYCELKSTILDSRVLRARHPAGIAQEIWAILAAYQALRITMTDAVGTREDLPCDRLSFTTALLEARDQIVHTSDHINATTIDLIGPIGAAVLAKVLPPRRIRTRARVVKRALSRYPAKGRDVDRRTYPATLRTEILTPPPDP